MEIQYCNIRCKREKMECNNKIQNIEIYERKVGQRRIEQDNEDKSSLHCTLRLRNVDPCHFKGIGSDFKF